MQYNAINIYICTYTCLHLYPVTDACIYPDVYTVYISPILDAINASSIHRIWKANRGCLSSSSEIADGKSFVNINIKLTKTISTSSWDRCEFAQTCGIRWTMFRETGSSCSGLKQLLSANGQDHRAACQAACLSIGAVSFGKLWVTHIMVQSNQQSSGIHALHLLRRILIYSLHRIPQQSTKRTGNEIHQHWPCSSWRVG